ncbi:serine hydrolase [uncultured Gemella sp.]|uniref:serine hydrolase n=1 Tax=uncultured Gemella sp. TaxID=254352 RepID=UPI0028D58278|nr:serine hydrolase [uncultured Gemella sp.]
MKRTGKRILKFIIESTAVILIIYGVFSAGAQIKARKDAIKQQELAQQEAQNEENKQEEPVVENKKLSEIELNEAMENLLEQYKGNNEIGIVYKNFSTGYRYAQEDKHYFTAASTIKVIYAMKIYDRIRNGELSKDADIYYNPKFLEEGNGQITNNTKQDSYKLDYVIQNMIQYSDNTATNMLMGNSATASAFVVKYLSEMGVTLPQVEAQKNRITPAMMEVVWTKLYKERDKYPELLKYLEDSDDGEWIKEGIPDKKVASKYGAIETNYHDTALVFGDKDYMLLIYTNNLNNSGQSIKNIAKKIDEITNKNM